MKQLKKILSFTLAVLMVFAVGIISVSAEDEQLTDTKIYFEAPDDWTGYTTIYCYIWNYETGEVFINWQSKKGACTLEENGCYSYDTAKIGGLAEDVYYGLIMSSNAGSQTYDVYLGTPCLGDTLYCEGLYYENPVDSSQTVLPAYWRNQDPSVYGPIMQITSIGNVVGTCMRDDQTEETLLSDFLSGDNLINTQIYSGKTDQQIIDDLAKALGLSDQTVHNIIKESGVSLDWTPGSPVTDPTDPTPAEGDFLCKPEDYEYTVLDDGTAKITKYNGKDEYIIIPAEIDGYKVSVLGKGGNAELTKGVKISDGIATIDESAFAYFKNLESVEIPSTVTHIQHWAFIHCDALKEIYLPESLKSIGLYGTFGYCDSLKKIEVAPENPYFTSLDGVLYSKDMTVIYQYPCGKTDASFTAPETVTEVFREAFAAVMYLKDINLPDGLKTIGYGGFAYSDSIETVDLGTSLETMVKSAFESCDSLKSISLPGTLKNTDMHIFQNCTALESVILSEGITSLPTWAFSGCEALKSITFPESMETIGYSSFSGCHSLTEVVIPKNVKKLGNGAFFNCNGLKSAVIESTDLEFGPASLGVSAAVEGKFPPIDGFVLIGYKGSTTEAYANEHNITFLDIEADILLGDVNHDKVVNIKDASAIQKHTANLAPLSAFSARVADVNADSSANVKDATAIQKFVAKIDTGLNIGEAI